MPHYQPDYAAFFITLTTHARWRLPEAARDLVLETCLNGNGNKFQLHGIVVMPDHVHMILTPLSDQNGTFSLAAIMQSVKGASAHCVNKLLSRAGPVWQQESFDRALRKEETVERKLEYMLLNPARAGLVRDPLEYRWSWQELRAG